MCVVCVYMCDCVSGEHEEEWWCAEEGDRAWPGEVRELWERSKSSGALRTALDAPRPRPGSQPSTVFEPSYFLPSLSPLIPFWSFFIPLPHLFSPLLTSPLFPSSSLSLLASHPSSLNPLLFPFSFFLSHPLSTPSSLILSHFLSHLLPHSSLSYSHSLFLS